MANTFKNYTAQNVTTSTIIFTGAAATQTTLIGMTIANISGIDDTLVSVRLNNTYIVKNAIVSGGSALVPVGGEQKIVVSTGDTISVTSNELVDVVASVLEIN